MRYMKFPPIHQAGFGLIEIIVAVGLLVTIVSVGLISIIGSVSTNRLGDEHTEATLKAQEGIEAVRSIKKQEWDNITPGEYGLDSSGGTWQLGPTPAPGDKFARIVRILPVKRDADGAIIESGGTVDPDTVKIESSVTWAYTPTRINTTAVSTYVTNFEKLVPTDVCGAVLTGTETTDGTDLIPGGPNALIWSGVKYNSTYFAYSDASPTELEVVTDGDYLIAITLPMYRTDNLSNNDRSRIQAEIRVDGSKQDVGVGRSSYIRNNSDHNESSNHLHILLEDLTAGQKIQVFLEPIADTRDEIDQFISNQATLYAEYVSDSEQVFSASSTQGTNGTDLNSSSQVMQWTERRKNAGYTHDNGSNPEDITIEETGNYLVFVNIPLQSSSQRINVLGRIQLDGSEVPGGQFKQGYIRDRDGDNESSIHWSGVVRTTSPNQVLSVTVEQEAANGTTTVGGEQATLFVQRMPESGIYIGRGNTLTNGSDWNPSSTGSVQWTTDDAIDPSFYAHSSPEEIVVQQDGSYLLVYNDSLTRTGGGSRENPKVEVTINGNPYPGAETKAHYMRSSSNHTESSGSLVIPLQDLSAGDGVQVQLSRESTNGTVNANTDALLALIQKNACGTGTPGPSSIPWVELFDLTNDTTQDTGTTAWAVDTSALRASATFSVQEERFEASDTGGEGIWQSEEIDISSVGSVDLSIDLQGVGGLDSGGAYRDYLRVYYLLDGGGEVEIFYEDGGFNGGNVQTVSVSGLVGNTLQIVVRTLLTGNDEWYYWDNINVTKAVATPTSTPTPVPSPTPTATPVPTNTPTPPPTPTFTPSPTSTPIPSPTPIPIEVTLSASDDVGIWETYSFGNYGQYSDIFVRDDASMLLRFDLSSVPSGAQITSATVSLRASTHVSTGGTVDMYAILSGNAGWQEGDEYAGFGGSGDATWDEKDAGPPVPWAGSSGLRTVGTDYDATILDSVPATFSNGQWYNWDVDPSVVQTWLDTPSSNHGVVFFSTGSSFMFFRSEESGGTPNDPKLIIEYTLY